MLSAARTLQSILRHPLNRGREAAALRRYLSWQLGARLVPGPVAFPFVGDTRLLAVPGMTGATGNLYCGLYEFADMAFALHLLREGDLFADVGANVGAYTILASGAAGAATVALEPVPGTFRRLQDNLRLNGIEALVDARRIGVGSGPGTLWFTTGDDTTNHVARPGNGAAGESGDRLAVPTETLDDVLRGRSPRLVKIDVEGFETPVVDGAATTLASPQLWAVILELGGLGGSYGFDEAALHRRMLELGFASMDYDPFTRRLAPRKLGAATPGNVIYVREGAPVAERLASAPRHDILGRRL